MNKKNIYNVNGTYTILMVDMQNECSSSVSASDNVKNEWAVVCKHCIDIGGLIWQYSK